MARKPRETSETGIYYIYLEGAFGIKLFKDENDYADFAAFLKKASEKYDILMFAYSLGKNHAYLLLKENMPGTVGKFMQSVLSGYAVKYNNRYLRNGGITNGRYKSIPVQSFDEAFKTSAYINNMEPDGTYSSRNAYTSSFPDGLTDTSYIFDGIKENYGDDNAQHYYSEFLGKKVLPDNDFKKRRKLSPEQLDILIKKLCGIEPEEIASLEKTKRNSVLKKLVAKSGAAVSEISRATGISRGIISRCLSAKPKKSKTQNPVFDYKAKNDMLENTALSGRKDDIWLL